MVFPDGFIWGAASASYQIEGGMDCDGKGPSIWDVFSHQPGAVVNGDNGDVACDSYHRFGEDLDIMASLGIPNYRFSVSWPRVIPDGSGAVNEAGLAYYDKIVDGCIARGIEPWMTIYHWDLPQALQDKGGWVNRDIVEAFRYYTTVLAEHFSGRVKRFFTLNEPQIFIGLGYCSGEHAPGLKLSAGEQMECWHNMLLAHGEAVRVLREKAPGALIGAATTGKLGFIKAHAGETLAEGTGTEAGTAETPAGLSDFTFKTIYNDECKENPFYTHHWFLDPVVKGRYPDDPESPWRKYADEIEKRPEFGEEMKLISQPIDFIGLNVYNGIELDPENGYRQAKVYAGHPRTAVHWLVTPEVMYWGPRQIWERYGIPLIISEDGVSCNDRVYLDGKVHDLDRIDFLTRYLSELSDTIRGGVPVKGYFHWSFTDNMEWSSGYFERFGLVYIDFRTQDRTVKDSAYWYSDVIKGKK